ncbi:MAG TPA: phosphoketolase family protein, partial [Devosia sp.]|nr:phosphoketolase family protein [Devosia sp.]
NEGGELGYSLMHAYGAAFDNPDLIVACVIGDGEAETGPLAASWHSNKFLNPANDGAVLPILHLNGYKIANPTILGRMSDAELRSLLAGLGYAPVFVEGDEPMPMHRQMAAALDAALDGIGEIQARARRVGAAAERPAWPMIVLRSPKGWTGPKEVDGKKVEGFWRAHQVPVDNVRGNEAHRAILEAWMRSYEPDRLFDAAGRLRADLRDLAPAGRRRMSANPHANGGLLRRDLKLPDFAGYAIEVGEPGGVASESTRLMGQFLRDVLRLNAEARNFRIMGPDETTSNRLDAVFEATPRMWMEDIRPYDEGLGHSGRVMEVLSEHLCQGWLEGYLLTGRHGLFNCYEAFVHIVDSMFNQHAKWLKEARDLPWRQPVASLNYLLSSHVWRQDHNGFSHQDPGFVDLVANKKADIVRIYIPPDANTLLWTTDHVLRTWNRINVIVAGKQPAPQWLTMKEAVPHCEYGLGIWDWACLGPRSGREDGEPDIVMAAAGDVPTMETLAAIDLLHQALPELRIRMINVVDLMALMPRERHPHGISDEDFDALFTRDRPVVFAYHGYPYMIHRLTYRRTNHDNFHVHGFMEEGTTTTPFDMTVINELDRFHLAIAALDRLPSLGSRAAEAKQAFRHKLHEHHAYIREHGEDLPEIRNWVWPYARRAAEDRDW